MTPHFEEDLQGITLAAWGYVFLHINFTIGPLNLLPEFVGYLLMLAAISHLAADRKSLTLLRPLAWLLAGWTLLQEALSLLHLDLSFLLTPLQAIAWAAVLYFHFQFLTDLAALAQELQPEGEDLDRKLQLRRTLYLLVDTISILLRCFVWPWSTQDFLPLLVFFVIPGIVSALLVFSGLFSFRSCLLRCCQEWDTPSGAVPT